MEYILDKKVMKSIQELISSGNNKAVRAGVKASQVATEIMSNSKAPFGKLSLTNHGETRIKNCMKYDLKNGYRLITIQHKGVCTLVFVGHHDSCDRWLNTHRGYTLAIDPNDKTLVSFNKVIDISTSEGRPFPETDYSKGKLWEKLGDHYFDWMGEQIGYKLTKPFLRFESISNEDEILDACLLIENEPLQELFLEVFYALKKGDVDESKNLVLAYQRNIVLVEEATQEEKENIRSNDQFIRLTDLNPDFLRDILESSSWYDWMLFLHPLQRQVIDFDMSGPGRLLGVSGSGKTCVLVHRALRLAKKYPNEKVLLLTLNPSLADLIKELVNVLCISKTDKEFVSSIEVKSFWQLCSDLTEELGYPNKREWPRKRKPLNGSKNIDEVWSDFYSYQRDNGNGYTHDFFNIHQTLLARSVQPNVYIRQEFDWIRSALTTKNRKSYLGIERTGRKVPIIEEDRKKILKGLEDWEKKMNKENVIDYLGLSSVLYSYIDEIAPKYRCVLVDEVQDFGTIELEIIRKMVARRENDLFLTGDIAQQVYNKHHRLKQAGINISPANYKQILKNYRNSREILEAANSVFTTNINPEDYRSEDFQILPPEYANFSSPKPFLRKGNSLKDEVLSAVSYLEELYLEEPNRKGCIAFCGYTLNTVSNISNQFGYPSLDGNTDVKEYQIVFSDLEQTKGFEFDRMIIVNCNEIVFPNPYLPKEEWFRELSKLYVAMTRAKRELVVSWSSILSSVFSSSRTLFKIDNWSDHIEHISDRKIDLHPTGNEILSDSDYLRMKLPEFLFTPTAIGLSRDLQNKLIDLVAGYKSYDSKGRQDGWQSMLDLENSIRSRATDAPFMNSLFGPSIYMELQNFLEV